MSVILKTSNETESKEGTPPAESTVYELIRQDILMNQLTAGVRLNISELAKRYGTSINPIREALQQLRGEGLVLMTPNRGASVRPIDGDFVRDIYEMATLIEPYLLRGFVNIATDADMAQLVKLNDDIEENNFADQDLHCELDSEFHRLMYQRHYNRHAVDMWWKHREILHALSTQFPFSLSRRANILREHRELLAAINSQDPDAAAEVLENHVKGSGHHLIERLRSGQMR